MRLPSSEHTSRRWRIHEIAYDFDLEDVWALPTPGGRDDFSLLVEGFASLDLGRSSSSVVRGLFAARSALGRVFRWDEADAGLGARVEALRDRLPSDLRDTATELEFEALPASPVYLTEDEFAAEVANQTVHGIIHLGWVEEEDGRHRGQMAILVKRNGFLGAAYMAGITPFRYLFVYPRMMRELERSWKALQAARSGGV